MAEKPRSNKTLGIVIDALMYILLLAQMLYVFAGNTIHEILGIAMFLCVIAHLLIKRKWFAVVFKKGRKVSRARRFADILSLVLLALIIVLAISSMGVSRVIFPWFTYVSSPTLHKYLATAVLTVSVVHGGMHGYFRAKSKRKALVLIVLGAIAATPIGLRLFLI